MRKQYRLENLDCAHCAMEMEEAAKKIPGVDFVSVNFLSMKLTLEAEDNIFDSVFKKVVKTCGEVEPDCKILVQKYEMEDDEKKVLWRILAAAALFLIAKVLEGVGIVEEESLLAMLLYLPSYVAAGYDVIWKAVRNLLRGKLFDENFLMALATIGAVGTGEYHEAVLVMLLYQIGEFCQDLAVAKSRRSITELMDIRPDKANLIAGEQIKEVSPDAVPVGEAILIKPGEKVPLDGVVIEGNSFLDTAALTGESRPREVAAGDEILSGCVNMNGVLKVQTTKSFGESSVSKILALIENSGETKSHAETFISRFARYYTPIVVLAAVALAVIPPIFAGDWLYWLHKAITCLVISCPCALVISVPLAFFGGIGGAGKVGILVKGADSMEKLAKTSAVVFDKTGTLTKGVFAVTAIHPDEVSEEELLELAATCENYSDHPISHSLKAAFNKEIDKGRIGKVEEWAGLGVCAELDGKKIYVGNEKLMQQIGAAITQCDKCCHDGTIVHVAAGEKYLGHIVISDQLKEDSAEAVAAIRRLGIEKIELFSGDEASVAEHIGAELGIRKVHGNLLPQDKLTLFEDLLNEKEKNENVAFVGDGMNDVPVLARADIGIAMGSLGADAAIEAADVVLIDDHPKKIPLAIRIARKTLAIVRQNIAFSILVKLCVLLPNIFLPGVEIPLWLAIFADVGVCILAILNSARALRTK